MSSNSHLLQNKRSAMLEEILEQPTAIDRALQHYSDPGKIENLLAPVFANSDRLVIAASGSSRHAGLAGEIIIEDLCNLAVDVEYASEYLYRTTHSLEPALMVISQSGETADTLAALRLAKAHNLVTIAITNVRDSSMMKEALLAFQTCAGTESAVPASKSFTTQLVVLQLLALAIGRIRNSDADLERAAASLQELPELTASALSQWREDVVRLVDRYRHASAFMFLGRGIHYAIAREAALKLKEAAYRQAEAFPSGEVRHGPQALISGEVPVGVLATHDPEDNDSVLRYQKTLDVARELRAKGGEVIALINKGDVKARGIASEAVEVPVSNEYGLAVLEVMPLQLLACYLAFNDGIDPDHPRYLSKLVSRK